MDEAPAPHEPLRASHPSYDRADAPTEAAPLPVADPDATRIADVGAGIGHLALPLAKAGFDVAAIEPVVIGELAQSLEAQDGWS